MNRTLTDILDAAADGHFPPPDGGTTVVPQPSRRDAGVIAFTGHSVVFTDEDPQWVRHTLAALDCDSLAATMNPRFLGALLDRTRGSMDRQRAFDRWVPKRFYSRRGRRTGRAARATWAEL